VKVNFEDEEEEDNLNEDEEGENGIKDELKRRLDRRSKRKHGNRWRRRLHRRPKISGKHFKSKLECLKCFLKIHDTDFITSSLPLIS